MTRLLLLTFVLATAIICPAATLYVSPSGDDSWSGQVIKPAANRKDGPLATLPAAIQKARAFRQKFARPEPVSILLRGGEYDLKELVVLTPEDSGADAENLFTIAAFENERPIISGGRHITDWKKMTNRPGMWQANIPEVAKGDWYFRQLFINGERKQRARSPNSGFFKMQGPSPEGRPSHFKYNGDDIKNIWASHGDVELVALLKWTPLRMPIRSVDEANKVAVLTGEAHKSIREDNARYWIENAPEALDEPGEWYLNSKNGNLTYLARPNENLQKIEVVAPKLESLFHLQGDVKSKRLVRYIAIRGLTFSYTDWRLPETGLADSQAAISIRGDFRAEGAEHCIITGCTFSHLGNYAIELGAGCSDIEIAGNNMADLGAGGVRVGVTSSQHQSSERTGAIKIENNHIHHGGWVFPSAVGVLVLQSAQNRIAHNHIHHLFYTAISVGWTWGYRESPCYANHIEFNHLHDIGQDMLSDMGGVYLLGPQKGTVVRNNLIHDVTAYGYGGWGLYTDEGSSDIMLENNVVYRCQHANFHQHYGRENILRNNIFAFGKEHQLMRSREEEHISFFFTNNIVYFDSGDLLGSTWQNNKFVMNHNLYFDTRHHESPEDIKFAGQKLEDWRKHGQDRDSIFADPQFVAPQKGDFRLKRNSPMFKLGFKPIDVSQCGIEKEFRKARE